MWVARWFGRGVDGERPMLATLLFWLGLAGPFVTRLQISDAGLGSGWLLGFVAALIAVWQLLRWRVQAPDERELRDWPPWALLGIAFAYAMADSTGSSVTVLLVALAGVLVNLGLRAAVVGAVTLALILSTSVYLFVSHSISDAVGQGLGVLTVCGLAIAIAQGYAAERLRLRQVSQLLDQLQVANDELQRRAAQVRDLAISEERVRLSREVHDAVGHHLTVVKLGLTNAQRLRDRDAEAAWTAVSTARASADSALTEVRRAVRALGPSVLEQANLGTALDLLADSYQSTTLPMTVNVIGPVSELPSTVEAVLYRVAEEGLTNVVRHAIQPSQAVVSLSYHPDCVRLQVSDDGHDVGPLVDGFGLAGARARLGEVGGRLATSRGPQGGTLLTAEVPIG